VHLVVRYGSVGHGNGSDSAHQTLCPVSAMPCGISFRNPQTCRVIYSATRILRFRPSQSSAFVQVSLYVSAHKGRIPVRQSCRPTMASIGTFGGSALVVYALLLECMRCSSKAENMNCKDGFSKPGLPAALAAALLFGAGTPLAKWLLDCVVRLQGNPTGELPWAWGHRGRCGRPELARRNTVCRVVADAGYPCCLPWRWTRRIDELQEKLNALPAQRSE